MPPVFDSQPDELTLRRKCIDYFSRIEATSPGTVGERCSSALIVINITGAPASPHSRKSGSLSSTSHDEPR
jgi:hypothetical protein